MTIDLARLLVCDGAELDLLLGVEGHLPSEVVGALFRIGPGLFGRAGRRRGAALDGDGLVQRFAFDGTGVSYRSRFVRTRKFEAESQAERDLFPTWTNRAPQWWRNVGTARIRSQAGVTLRPADGVLEARDEVGAPWRIDGETLATLGEGRPLLDSRPVPKAHTRIDSVSGRHFALACRYGPRFILSVWELGDAAPVLRRQAAVPRSVYLHDFFLTPRHAVVLLHPAMFRPWRFLAGFASFVECLRWTPEAGNLWIVLPLDAAAPVRLFEGPPGWMWHGIRAVETGARIVLDWIGYDRPDHFLGPDAALTAMMAGRLGRADAPGRWRRTILGLADGRLAEEVVADLNLEFPVAEGDTAFATQAAHGTILADGIARLRLNESLVDGFRFGPGTHVGEPIPTPDGRWVLAPGLDAARGQSFLAVFAAGRLADGPLARAWLPRAMPGSFHGLWLQGRTAT